MPGTQIKTTFLVQSKKVVCQQPEEAFKASSVISVALWNINLTLPSYKY
jgi:hypothetical protein